MRIVITGATGLLGRNLLFEIIKQNLSNLDGLEIIVLGRDHETIKLEDRIEQIIKNDGLDYIGLNKDDNERIKQISRSIKVITFDLKADELAISKEGLEKLKKKRIDYFFHVAALTDFRTDSAVSQKLEEINVNGTKRIINFVDKIDVATFIYVGSAYSCGSKTGLVSPDYININETFRNPYEKSKLQAEILVREYAQRTKKVVKVFRPSTICGRLIEKPLGGINKFDVFYAWGAFFLHLKHKEFNSFENIYNKRYTVPIRIHFNPKSGLNIVPADYAAKVLYKASIDNWKGESIYLVNSEEAPHQLYVQLFLDELGIDGCSFVPQEPLDKKGIEKLYYKTVGKLFTPYAATDPIVFDLSNIQAKLQRDNLLCPKIDEGNIRKLIAFAKQKNFNIDKRH